MVGWKHQLNGHEFESAPGGGEGVLQSMGSQRAGHDWVTKQQQQQYIYLQNRKVGDRAQHLKELHGLIIAHCNTLAC